MNVEEAGGATTVTYDSVGLTKLMLGLTVLLLGVAAYEVSIGTRGTDRMIGLLASTATCAAIAIVSLETAWFQFTHATRIVNWRRRWAFRQRSGVIPFAAIQSVMVERPIGDDGTPSRRIVLRTTDGAVIPITVGYRPDADGALLQIANRLRTLLGHSAAETHTQNLKALIDAGSTIDAIRLLRQEEGLSLSEAKQRVDDLTRRSK
jgi:hypothetical protein